MRTSLRSIVDKMLGRTPGKTSRLDTATHPFSSAIGPGDCRLTTRFNPHTLDDIARKFSRKRQQPSQNHP